MKAILLRGISGSGKSTWIATHAPHAVIVSADAYFLQTNGTYAYDRERLHEAHKQCYRNYIHAIPRKETLIVVDNTNITVWELSVYAMPAEAFGYDLEILTLRCDPELAIQRKSLVPPEKIRRLASLLEKETKNFPSFMQKQHRIIQTDGASPDVSHI